MTTYTLLSVRRGSTGGYVYRAACGQCPDGTASLVHEVMIGTGDASDEVIRGKFNDKFHPPADSGTPRTI